MMKCFYNKFNQQRGAALPMVLLTILFLTLLGFMALTTSSVEVRLAANERDYQQAVYAAEAGVAHTRAVLKGLLNVCNQSNIASGGTVTWDFVLQDIADCPALAGQARPLSIQSSLGNYQYHVNLANNDDDLSGSTTVDGDQKIIMTSIATGVNGVRAGIEIVLDTENSASEVSGYSGQFGAGSGKSFTGRDANAITNTTTKNLGNL
jgi:Tfp pilus assembly protein PilX